MTWVRLHTIDIRVENFTNPQRTYGVSGKKKKNIKNCQPEWLKLQEKPWELTL